MRRTDLPASYRAAAPVRLDFAGGWTDVPPFSARAGGEVVNAAIALQVEAELDLGGKLVRLVSEDLAQTVECADSTGLVLDGKLNLLKAALRMFPVQGPLTLRTRAQAPPGSGLGSSGALDVALVACLAAARQDRLDARELAEQAWLLETREAGIPGGRQDQLAAALGGFNRLTFRDPDVGIEPITIDAAFAEALERQIVLCYTGRSRVSGHTIARVMGAYERGDPGVTGALEAMKDITFAMAEALRASDLGKVGALLSENWTRQRALDPGMQTEEMAALERAMREAQVLGGKAAGAGAGGSMFFLAKTSSRSAAEAAREIGVTVLPFRWAWEGGRVW
jgi:D-glycero-alpha-D-manno-heptose-7-phosphate kinase